MADIQLRFHHDMLVFSAPIDYALARQGVDVNDDFEFTSVWRTRAWRIAPPMWRRRPWPA